MQDCDLIIHTDGGSRGNPGPAACAFIAESEGKVLEKKSRYLDIATNNTAEYQAVILAFEWLIENRKKFEFNNIVFLLDSELVIKQLSGVYKIKKTELRTFNLQIRNYMSNIETNIKFKHVPREQNKIADYLVNQELDKH
jgi:ribonuclease HI